MPSSFHGKSYIVTGAGSGVGRSQTEALLRAGANVCALDLAKMPTLDSNSSHQVLTIQGDITDPAIMPAAVSAAVSQWGRVDGLCATAGVCNGYGPMWELADADVNSTLATNIMGTWHSVQAVARHWVSTSGTGHAIVITNSIGGLKGLRSVSHYVTSKHAQLGIMRSAALELAPWGIRVNALAPTNVDTPMFQRPEIRKIVTGIDTPTQEEFESAAAADHMLKTPWVEPSDVANGTLWLLSDAARFTTGAVLPIDAGALSL